MQRLEQVEQHRWRWQVASVLLLCCLPILCLGQSQLTGTIKDAATQLAIDDVSILDEQSKQVRETNADGRFEFSTLAPGRHNLIIFAEGYSTLSQEVQLQEGANVLDLSLDSLSYTIEAIEVEAEKRESFGLRRLRNVEGMAIYAAKKSEVIDLTNAIANLATNNPRQVYKGIAGLNIWENDGAGLQLSIGARGLDPNRTSNFNTRQNGYDISADALGYPESYYTPPTQALSKIEIVRGAASLQYGTQFGGLLNFIFRKGP
ncbi:MAG: carboxypeptidase regulatory-like domain-containing protein, partial [Bacteroidota bacterium]